MSAEVRGKSVSLDALKLVFTILVFIWHTSDLGGGALVPKTLGWISVHFFFIVSGMLLAKSTAGISADSGAGKQALSLVLRRVNGIKTEYLTALLICGTGYIIIYGKEQLPTVLSGIFPELFGVSYSGLKTVDLNVPAWYISAMLICMLPLAYLLIKRRDMFLHVLAPSAAILLYAYLFRTCGGNFSDRWEFDGFISRALIRAACGMCFGAVSYLISERLGNADLGRGGKALVTAGSFLCFAIFFTVLFTSGDNYAAVFSAGLLLPPAVGLVFSGKGILSRAPSFELFGLIRPLTLAIYLDHWTAWRIVYNYFGNNSYIECAALMALFTIILCAVYFALILLFRTLWKKMKAKKKTPSV